MKSLTSIVPTRIDLAGGTLDLWPLHQLLDIKATVNMGITLNATVTISPATDNRFHIYSIDQNTKISGDWSMITNPQQQLILPALLIKHAWSEKLPPFQLEIQAKSPAGAGLGGSSCLAISILNALFGAREHWFGELRPPEAALVDIAKDIEAKIIHAPTGIQDYWGGVRGRINILRFPPGATEVQTIAENHLFQQLNDHLIVCYSGQARASALNNWQVFKKVFDNDQSILNSLREIGHRAHACSVAVENQDLQQVLSTSHTEWRLRTQLWPDIETEVTKSLDKAALNAGAMFSRVCGAGGGGVMAIFTAPERRGQVIASLQAAGGQILNAQIAKQGMKLVTN